MTEIVNPIALADTSTTHQVRLTLSTDIFQRHNLVGADSLSQPIEPFPSARIRSLGVDDRSRRVMLSNPSFDARNRLLESRLVLVVIRHNAAIKRVSLDLAGIAGTYMS
jgi:hypothetical protein